MRSERPNRPLLFEIHSSKVRHAMRASQFLISTLKEAPADADVVSQQLMLRAGMIKKLAAGIYTRSSARR